MKDFPDIPQAPLRPPAEVMRLKRMGAMFPTRLSFLRTLMRRLAAEQVQVRRPVWEIGDAGFGHAVYSLELGGYAYSLVAVATDLPPGQRTDRVIATAWDTAYVLYDGVPDADEIARICAAAPRQEAARFTERDLVLSRANKSFRLFSHVVERLRAGRQPDEALVRATGYLMRTTAVYGNGKFGIADRAVYDDRPGLEGPFMAEMLTVWLIRLFTHDLAEHLGGGALDRRLKRHLGIGNSTGLGMAPFLVNHPVLLNNWMMVRETALARVRAVTSLDAEQIACVQALYKRVARHLAEWDVPDPAYQARIAVLRQDWRRLAPCFATAALAGEMPVARLLAHTRQSSVDLQELMAALVMEPFGGLVDGLADCMSDPFGAQVVPFAGTADLAAAVDAGFAWALAPDYGAPDQCRQFWYVSAAKQEPRLGLRFDEPGEELESPLDIARSIKALRRDLNQKDEPLSAFLARFPEHALAASRVALGERYPYAEIRDNLIADTCLPIDMLRCKLAFFGASRFDPRSDRWTRITLCQGAPLADELDTRADDWWLPVFGG
ncbi:hypothetical protein [Roseobacter ponti]|uniref:Uncharacterized protein n=1 Tax=Roseobacter ponti TaxID=1891787 RepID=A0A858SQ50_9RHOB|nr:hypothetical protein [Roseobacter ponti]QJF50510.1 hypothetical protein G3256_04725 [Roseobacter ponti]